MLKRVSVVLPLFRFDQFVESAIISTIQNLPSNSEIVVVINGEARREESKINRLKDLSNSIVVVRSDEIGIVSALNLGISHAKGQYIARMDHDDLMLNGRLQKQLKFLDSNKHIGIIGCDVLEIDETDKSKSRWGVPKRISRILFFPVFSNIAHPSVMMRAEILKSLNGYREIFPNTEDHDLWCRARKITKIRNLPFIGLGYRIHSGQTSGLFNSTKSLNTLRSYLFNELEECIDRTTLMEQLNCLNDTREFLELIQSNLALKRLRKIQIKLAILHWQFVNEFIGGEYKKLFWVIRNIHFIFFELISRRRVVFFRIQRLITQNKHVQ